MAILCPKNGLFKPKIDWLCPENGFFEAGMGQKKNHWRESTQGEASKVVKNVALKVSQSK
jgi:hypothetical protein